MGVAKCSGETHALPEYTVSPLGFIEGPLKYLSHHRYSAHIIVFCILCDVVFELWYLCIWFCTYSDEFCSEEINPTTNYFP